MACSRTGSERAADGIAEDAWEESIYLLRIAVARLLKQSFEAHPVYEVPAITVTRDPAFSLKVLGLLQHLALVEHGRRVAQSVQAGLGTIEFNDGAFAITLLPQLDDEHFWERALEKDIADAARVKFAAALAEIAETVVNGGWILGQRGGVKAGQ